MTALVEQTTEFCPHAKSWAYLDANGVCGFCNLVHSRPKLADRISKMQLEAFTKLAGGMVPKEVAADFGMNRNTLMGHVRDARLALGARTTEQAIAMLAREGSL